VNSYPEFILMLTLGQPWNLSKNNKRLEDGWFYQNVYARSLGGNLVRMFERHAETVKQWPDHPISQVVTEIVALKKTPLIGEFDQICTRLVGGSQAPHGPFPFASGEDVRSCHTCAYMMLTRGSTTMLLPQTAYYTPWACLCSP
jgi:hypothetical protein